MTKISDSKVSNNNTTNKVLITAGLTVLSSGDLIYQTIKNHRVDKTPLKDSFIKTVKDAGNIVQNAFSPLKKHSSLKIGSIAIVLGTILDISIIYWAVNKFYEKFKK